jgi:chromosome segregation ATPase
MLVQSIRNVGALVLVLTASSCLVGAQDHEEKVKRFQNGVNYSQDNKGCLSIPYSDLQDQCQRKQADVVRWCKQSGKWNCEDVDPKALQAQVERIKTERDRLKEERANYGQKKSSASEDRDKQEYENKIKETDNKLYELDRSRGTLERQVSEASKTVSDRTYVAKSCRDARPEVMEVFRGAKSRADGEQDPDIRPLAQRLIKYWEIEGSGHNEQIRTVKDAVEKCDRILYDIGHLGNY